MKTAQRIRIPGSIVLLGAVAVMVLSTGCSAPKSSPTSSSVTSATASLSSVAPTATSTSVTSQLSTTVSTTVPSTSSGTSTTAVPTTVYVPAAAPYKPSGAQLELFQYALSLINKDRADYGQPPLTLDYNAAAQKHAQDVFDNYFCSHWGTDGLKPYMRYTVEGGLGFEGENSAYSGWYNSSDNPANYAPIDVRQEIADLERMMMYDDAAANWGHRDSIVNKWARKVSLGIVYDDRRVAFVEQFEGQFVEYFIPPTLSGSVLFLSGRITSPDITVNNISIAFDALPQTLTNSQLVNDATYTDGYSLGNRVNFIISTPPPGQSYGNLPAEAIQAARWDISQSGQFSIQADISRSLSRGKGVYTIVIVGAVGGESVNLTNFSIFVR